MGDRDLRSRRDSPGLDVVSRSAHRVAKEAMRRGLPHNLKSSDQMPEEAPAEQVPDDVPEAPEGAAREAARRHAKDARRHHSGETGTDSTGKT